jgi:hypothetical protein
MDFSLRTEPARQKTRGFILTPYDNLILPEMNLAACGGTFSTGLTGLTRSSYVLFILNILSILSKKWDF